MARACAILKYIPAVLSGVLIVAWGFSLLRMTMVVGLGSDGQSEFVSTAGTVGLVWERHSPKAFGFEIHRNLQSVGSPLGFFAFWQDDVYYIIVVACPICCLLTWLLPFAVSPFTHFRFPLWSYFAWTALIALELAYYLR